MASQAPATTDTIASAENQCGCGIQIRLEIVQATTKRPTTNAKIAGRAVPITQAINDPENVPITYANIGNSRASKGSCEK